MTAAPSPHPPAMDPITEELRQLNLPPLTEMGNAERFAYVHATDVRYVHGLDEWRVWDGKRWAADRVHEVTKLAAECVRLMKGDVPALSLKTAEAVVKHAVKSEGEARLKAMLSLARALSPLALVPEALDRDPYALNVDNGIVDLKTGELRRHRHDELHTKLVPIAYDENAEAPTWAKFLERVLPDPAVRSYVQRAVGYSLTGDVGEHCLIFCYGTGRNGKSTLLELLRSVAGDYAKTSSPDLLLAKRSERHEEEVAELHGARFVSTVEAGEGRAWDETRVKWFTGGDTLTARHMYASRFSFAPTHKLWIAANHKPHVRGTDLGFWRRVHLIPFAVTIPEEERDPDLRTKLERELPGILRWAVDGAVAWREAGLRPPPAVRAATDDYRSSEDVLGHFIAEQCVVTPNARVPMKMLHAAYESWAEANGERAMSKIDLGKSLEERPGIARYRNTSSRGLTGIGLRSGQPDPNDTNDASTPLFDNSSKNLSHVEKLSETPPEASFASLPPPPTTPIRTHRPGCECADGFRCVEDAPDA